MEKQTYFSDGFELDLDAEWRAYEEPDDPGLLYFQHLRLDAALSAWAEIINAYDRDLDEFGQASVSKILESLQVAFSTESSGRMEIEAVEAHKVSSGLEFEIKAKTPGRGRFLLYIIVRPYLILTLRIESLTLPESQLEALFDSVQLGLFVGQPVQNS